MIRSVVSVGVTVLLSLMFLAAVAAIVQWIWPELSLVWIGFYSLLVLLGLFLVYEILVLWPKVMAAARPRDMRSLSQLLQKNPADPEIRGQMLAYRSAIEERMLTRLVEQITTSGYELALQAHHNLRREDEALIQQIHKAVRADRMQVFVQPIVSLPQRKHRFYDCFVVLEGDEGQSIDPDTYWAHAEEEGLLPAIDNLLLLRCLQLIRRTHRDKQNFGFFCNISKATLRDQEFFPDFLLYLRDNPDMTKKLVFQMSEAEIERLELDGHENLQRLLGLGAQFSVRQMEDLNFDLNRFEQMRVRYLKFPADFLLERIHAPVNPLDLDELVAQLDRLAIDVIADHVSDEKQLVELLDHKIDFGEGSLFAEPRKAP